MIKGIIFDMDGVIIDSNNTHYDVWNRTFQEEFDVCLDKKEFASRLGESAKHFAEYFLKRHNIEMKPSELLKKTYVKYESTNRSIELKKGVIDTLKKLKNDYKIALATGANREYADFIVSKFDLSDLFDYVIAGDEVKIAKPEPDIFLKAAEKIGVKPSEAVVIEDAFLGLTAAKKAGMVAVSIPDEFTKLQDHSIADHHLKKISEVVSLVTKLNAKH